MPPVSNQFLLVGNGTYQNRGCEGIVRGTAEILRKTFGDDSLFKLGIYGDDSYISHQSTAEQDKKIHTFPLKHTFPRWSSDWFVAHVNRRFRTNIPGVHSPLLPHVNNSFAALEIGGDNYSLDYGLPWYLINMDRFLQSRGVPVILWGASVGPFNENLEFAEHMFEHLRSLSAIFVRETASQDYLHSHGVSDNVYLMADPAFVMPAEQPTINEIGFQIPEHSIGLNFSPLIARYFSKQKKNAWELNSEDISPWLNFCAEFVVKLSKKTERDIILVPHVHSNSISGDDYELLSEVARLAAPKCQSKILCLSNNLSAAKTKWVISQCSIFVGARTHSTIAALSSKVPTLSIGYSIKARGINQDVFSTQDYCIPSHELTQDRLMKQSLELLTSEFEIRNLLEERIPQMKKRAYLAGSKLKDILLKYQAAA